MEAASMTKTPRFSTRPIKGTRIYKMAVIGLGFRTPSFSCSCRGNAVSGRRPSKTTEQESKWAIPTFGILIPRTTGLVPPGMWKPSWVDPEVRLDVLQAVLPQQRQGNRLHQDYCRLPFDARRIIINVSCRICAHTLLAKKSLEQRYD
ncbi:hypothetical protein ACE6H2_004297 [Prunus campanulata]